MADPYAPREIAFRRRFLIATLLTGAALAAITLTWPEIDLKVSETLRLCPSASFAAPWCLVDPTVGAVRNAFIALSVFFGIAVAIGGLWTILVRRSLVGLDQLRWLYLAAALAVGPGLVANVVLKDNWGRARPRQVVEFGGTQQFTPPLLPVNECQRNCAFVSGEASSMYVPFFAAALLLPQARVALLVAGAGLGLAAGLVRISQGAHFLSDILFAGVFMALTASVLHILMIGLWRTHGPGHYGAIALAQVTRAWQPAYSTAMTIGRSVWDATPSMGEVRSHMTSMGESAILLARRWRESRIRHYGAIALAQVVRLGPPAYSAATTIGRSVWDATPSMHSVRSHLTSIGESAILLGRRWRESRIRHYGAVALAQLIRVWQRAYSAAMTIGRSVWDATPSMGEVRSHMTSMGKSAILLARRWRESQIHHYAANVVCKVARACKRVYSAAATIVRSVWSARPSVRLARSRKTSMGIRAPSAS